MTFAQGTQSHFPRSSTLPSRAVIQSVCVCVSLLQGQQRAVEMTDHMGSSDSSGDFAERKHATNCSETSNKPFKMQHFFDFTKNIQASLSKNSD